MFPDIDLHGKRVLIRVDFNVPLSSSREVRDATRIEAAAPTIKELLGRGARVILMSHLGRPDSDKNEDGSTKRSFYSLIHIVDDVERILGAPVHFVDDTIGTVVQHAADALKDGEVLLLENTRFYREEKSGDPDFARSLAQLADYYVNDAFGAAHRAHASTATVAHYFDHDHKAFGLLMQRELDEAKKLTDTPDQPFVAILGGAKVSDKIQLIERLLDKVQTIIIGGGMAYTFIAAQGGRIGKSLVEEDKLDLAKSLLTTASDKKVKLILPIDSKCNASFEDTSNFTIHPSDDIPSDLMGLDIGPQAIEQAKAEILQAKTIFWNGPMGVFEFNHFADGTMKIADAVADSTASGAFSLIGGGDSVSAVHQSGHADDVSFISTGGGAMLTLLEGGDMPGVDAIIL